MTLKFGDGGHKLATSARITLELVRRDMAVRYAGSLAGVLWSVGVPLLNAAVLSTVFSWLMAGRMGLRYDGVPFPVFYFAGIAPWTLFAESVARSTSVIVENASIVKRVRFPMETFCMQVVGSAFISYGVMIFSAMLLMVLYGLPPTPRLIWLLPLLAITACLALGVCFVLSALAVYFRDIAQIIPVVLNLAFFLTPILYPPSLVEHAPLWARLIILDLNPMHYLVEAHRYCIIGAADIGPGGIFYVGAVSVLIGMGGLVLFRKLKSGFADVL